MASTNDIISGITRTQEERILLTQIAQKAETCREKCYLTHTKFWICTRRRWQIGCCAVWGNAVFSGADMSRRNAAWSFFCRNGWMPCRQRERTARLLSFAVCAAKMTPLTHRDYLGSLMGLGLRRDGIGDILVSEHGADILVLKDIAPYLLMHYSQAGRKHLQTEEIRSQQLIVPEEKVTMLRDTVAP